MPELTLAPDPQVWSDVVDDDGAQQWRDTLVASAPPERQADVFEAANLALRTRASVDAVHVLFLDALDSLLLGALAVFAYDDLPPAATQQDAESIAGAMVPSNWELQTVPAELAESIAGWRVTVVGETSGEESGATITAVWTVYVLNADGRCVVALLSASAPFAAALAQMHAEQALSTIEVRAS